MIKRPIAVVIIIIYIYIHYTYVINRLAVHHRWTDERYNQDAQVDWLGVRGPSARAAKDVRRENLRKTRAASRPQSPVHPRIRPRGLSETVFRHPFGPIGEASSPVRLSDRREDSRGRQDMRDRRPGHRISSGRRLLRMSAET